MPKIDGLKQKAIIGGAIGVPLLLLICILLWNSPPSSLSGTLDAFKNHQIEDATEQFSLVKHSLSTTRRELTDAYLKRAQKDWEGSNSALQRAFKASKSSLDLSERLEVVLGQALNYYLTNDQTKLLSSLKEAENIDPLNSWIPFFRTIYQCREGRAFDSSALDRQKKFPPYLSPWMKICFETYFNSEWATIQKAQCEIAHGNYLLARQTLIKLQKQHSEIWRYEIYYLTGLSYFKEGMSKPITASIPYFKLAFSYFDQIPSHYSRFQKTKQELISAIEQYAEQYLNERHYKEATSLVEILKGNGNFDYLASLHAHVDNTLITALETGDLETISALVPLSSSLLDISTNERYRLLFSQAIQQALEKNQLQNASFLLNIAETLKIPLKTDFLEDNLKNSILTLLIQKKSSLDQINHAYITWLNLRQSEKTLDDFQVRLLESLTHILRYSDQYSDVLDRLNWILEKFSSNERMLFTTRNILQEMLKSSLDNNESQQASLLVDVLSHPCFHQENPFKQDILQKFYTFAEYYYDHSRYDIAKLWIQNALDKGLDDPKGLHLAGRICYALGDYKPVPTYLDGSADDQDLERITVSRILFEPDFDAEAVSLSSEAHLRLALAFIERKDFQNADKWLTQVEPDHTLYPVFEMIFSFQKEDFDRVIEIHDKMSETSRSFTVIRIFHAFSLGYKGDLKTAEAILKEKGETPPTTWMYPPLTFLPPFKKYFERYDLPIALADFYVEFYQDSAKAIETLESAPNPSLEHLLHLVKMKLSNRQYDKIEEYLGKIASYELSSRDQEKWALRHAEYEYLKGQYIDSYLWYQRTNHPFVSPFYPHLLNIVKLYPQLIEHAHHPLTKPLDFILETVFATLHTQEFSRARQLIRQILKEKKLSNAQKLQIAVQSIPLRKIPELEDWIHAYLERNQISEDEYPVVLNYLIRKGSFKKALAIAQVHADSPDLSEEGLFSTFKLYKMLDDKKQALYWGNKLTSSYPEKIKYVVETAPLLPPEEFDQAVHYLNQEMNRYPDSISLPAYFCAMLFTRSQKPDETLGRFTKYLHVLEDKLERFVIKNPGIPEVYALLGQTYIKRGRTEEAINTLNESLEYDPTNVTALRSLALLLSNKSPNEALLTIRRALQYAPYDSLSWQIKGHIESSEGNYEGTISDLHQAIYYRPHSIDNYLALAHAYLEVKNPEEAKNTLNRALKIAPENKDAWALLLQCLYDPFLDIFTIDSKNLSKEREIAYEKLKAIDTQFAEQTLEKVRSN